MAGTAAVEPRAMAFAAVSASCLCCSFATVICQPVGDHAGHDAGTMRRTVAAFFMTSSRIPEQVMKPGEWGTESQE